MWRIMIDKTQRTNLLSNLFSSDYRGIRSDNTEWNSVTTSYAYVLKPGFCTHTKKRLKGYRLSEIEIFFSVPTLLLQNGATVHDFYYNALEAAFVPLLMLLFKCITLVSLFTCLIQDYQKLKHPCGFNFLHTLLSSPSVLHIKSTFQEQQQPFQVPVGYHTVITSSFLLSNTPQSS